MSTVAFLSVAPVVEGSMSEQVARAVDALEDHPVRYETTPMGTIIEADEAAAVFLAAAAAHAAVDSDRVSTFLKLDDKRGATTTAADKVASVERHLGRAAAGDHREGHDAR